MLMYFMQWLWFALNKTFRLTKGRAVLEFMVLKCATVNTNDLKDEHRMEEQFFCGLILAYFREVDEEWKLKPTYPWEWVSLH